MIEIENIDLTKLDLTKAEDIQLLLKIAQKQQEALQKSNRKLRAATGIIKGVDHKATGDRFTDTRRKYKEATIESNLKYKTENMVIFHDQMSDKELAYRQKAVNRQSNKIIAKAVVEKGKRYQVVAKITALDNKGEYTHKYIATKVITYKRGMDKITMQKEIKKQFKNYLNLKHHTTAMTSLTPEVGSAILPSEMTGLESITVEAVGVVEFKDLVDGE